MPPTRPRPRDLAAGWPESPIADMVGEVARRFALALGEVKGGRGVREIAEITGVAHTTIARILAGDVWPDIATVARLEIGLGVPLWPIDHIAR